MTHPNTRIRCKVFEDNTSAISAATAEKVTKSSKHISTKYHHFKQYVVERLVELHHIPTTQQIADIFTKPLQPKQFLVLRKLLMGW